MATPILDTLMGMVNPGMLGNIANQLGESPQNVSTGMKSGVSAILAGLVHKAGDTGTMSQVAQAATSVDTNTVLSNPGSLLNTGAAPGTASADGLLSMLFGGNAGGISDMIARSSGLKSSSAGALLSMAAPMVLGLLKRQSGGSISASSLSSTLMSQRDSILADAPAGLGSLLGIGGARAAAGAASSAAAGARSTFDGAANRARSAAETAPAAGRSWLMPLLLVLALAVAAWFMFGRGGSKGSASAAADSATSAMSAAAGVTGAVDSAAGAVAGAASGAAASLGAFARHALPGGVELNIPANGVENHLLAFITDSSRPVSDTVWFNFDRLLFETGSSKLTAGSKEQLDNTAAILKAYPAVNLKLGGYTDNVGNAAANLKLSAARANAVKADLVSRGIAANRLAAEGYGDAHPVADNSTPAGRDQNRRIAMRVTKK